MSVLLHLQYTVVPGKKTKQTDLSPFYCSVSVLLPGIADQMLTLSHVGEVFPAQSCSYRVV